MSPMAPLAESAGLDVVRIAVAGLPNSNDAQGGCA